MNTPTHDRCIELGWWDESNANAFNWTRIGALISLDLDLPAFCVSTKNLECHPPGELLLLMKTRPNGLGYALNGICLRAKRPSAIEL